MKDLQKIVSFLKDEQSSWLLFQMQKCLIFIPTILLQVVLLLLLIRFFCILYSCRQQTVLQRKLVLLFLGILLCSFAWYAQNQIYSKQRAFVVKDIAFVYAGPEKSFHKISQLKLGTQVQLLKCQADMCQISIHGNRGWIASDQIEIV